MENAVDALYMAGAVLILIIALSVSISSLMTLKSRTYDIVTMDEQINETSYIEDGKLKYVNYITSDDMDVRIVGADAVTSALYRLVTEDYKIYIKLMMISLLVKWQFKKYQINMISLMIIH